MYIALENHLAFLGLHIYLTTFINIYGDLTLKTWQMIMWVALVNCKLWYIENIWSSRGEGGQSKFWIASKSSNICFSLPKFEVIFWFILWLSRRGNWIRKFNISILEIDFWILNVDINFHSQNLNIHLLHSFKKVKAEIIQWPWNIPFIGLD